MKLIVCLKFDRGGLGPSMINHNPNWFQGGTAQFWIDEGIHNLEAKRLMTMMVP
jgi:hypothetical protein